MHLQQTIGNQAVQRMIKSGALQLKDNRPQPGDFYTREVDNLKQRVKRASSNPLSQQKATIPLTGPPIQFLRLLYQLISPDRPDRRWVINNAGADTNQLHLFELLPRYREILLQDNADEIIPQLLSEHPRLDTLAEALNKLPGGVRYYLMDYMSLVEAEQLAMFPIKDALSLIGIVQDPESNIGPIRLLNQNEILWLLAVLVQKQRMSEAHQALRNLRTSALQALSGIRLQGLLNAVNVLINVELQNRQHVRITNIEEQESSDDYISIDGMRLNLSKLSLTQLKSIFESIQKGETNLDKPGGVIALRNEIAKRERGYFRLQFREKIYPDFRDMVTNELSDLVSKLSNSPEAESQEEVLKRARAELVRRQQEQEAVDEDAFDQYEVTTLIFFLPMILFNLKEEYQKQEARSQEEEAKACFKFIMGRLLQAFDKLNIISRAKVNEFRELLLLLIASKLVNTDREKLEKLVSQLKQSMVTGMRLQYGRYKTSLSDILQGLRKRVSESGAPFRKKRTSQCEILMQRYGILLKESTRLSVDEVLQAVLDMAHDIEDFIAQVEGKPKDETKQSGTGILPTIARNDTRITGAPRGRVHRNALREAAVNTGVLRMIFNRTAQGRTGPNRYVNHIHIEGNAQHNILFDNSNYYVYGFVHGHMEMNMTSTIRNEVNRVNDRREHQANMIDVVIISETLYEIV